MSSETSQRFHKLLFQKEFLNKQAVLQMILNLKDKRLRKRRERKYHEKDQE